MTIRSTEACRECKGYGQREVVLTSGEKIYKKCFICKGDGFIYIFRYDKNPVLPAVRKQEKIIHEKEKPKNFLNLALGDLSWIKKH